MPQGAAVLLVVLAAAGAGQEPPAPAAQESATPTERDLFDKLRQEEMSTKTARPVARAPSSVSVLTGDDAQRLGIRFLPDALRRIPGLEVERISSTESTVSVRGYNDDTSASQGILGLVDGRQVYNEFFGAVVWESIPVSLDDVERIEVVRGPGSFVHGPNAMHGLVNIVTRSPLQYPKDTLRLSGSAGSYRSSQATATFVRREGDAALKATLGWDDINEFHPATGNAKDKKFLELRYETEFEKDHRLDFAVGANEQRFNILIPTLAVLAATQFANEVEEKHARATWTFGGLRLQATALHFQGASTPDTPDYPPFDTDLDTADLDLQYSLSPLEGHALTAGTGTRIAAFETDDLDVAGGRHRTGLLWGFLQDEITVSDHFWLTGGLRMDDHTIAGTRMSPRAAAVWEAAEKQYLRVSAGYGFRNPSLREIWFGMPVLGGAGTILGNRQLEAEKLRSVELSYSGRPAGEIDVRGNLYYSLVDRLVEFRSVGPAAFAPANTGKEEAYGIELEAEVLLADPVSVFANWAYGVRLDRETHDRNRSAPRNKAAAGARLTLDRLSAMLWTSFFDEVEFDDPTGGASIGAADAYALLNARVSYRLPFAGVQGRAFLQAFNLLDHDHREHPQGDSYGLILSGGLEIAW